MSCGALQKIAEMKQVRKNNWIIFCTRSKKRCNKWGSRGPHLWQSGGRDMESLYPWRQRSVGKVRGISKEDTTPKGSKPVTMPGQVCEGVFTIVVSNKWGAICRLLWCQLYPNVSACCVWGRRPVGAGPQRGASVNVDSRAMGWFVLLGGMGHIVTKGSKNQSSRFEPKFSLISFSRSSDPPLIDWKFKTAQGAVSKHRTNFENVTLASRFKEHFRVFLSIFFVA